MKKEIYWQSISWPAIFSGVLAGFALNFLFNLVILALGISIFNLDAQGSSIFSYIGIICYLVSSFITMYIVGWVAGRLTPPLLKRWWGALIGFIAWSLLLIVTIVLLTNVIQFVSFHSTFTSHPNMVAIRIANDSPFMTETKELSPNQSPLGINIEKVQKTITLNATVTFALFLIGALSSCVGGWVGYGRSQQINKDAIG